VGWFEGLVGGFEERRQQTEAENQRTAELAADRERRILDVLSQSSVDKDIRALAFTELMGLTGGPKKKGGLRGWAGQYEQSPALQHIQALIDTPVYSEGTAHEGLPSRPIGGGWVPPDLTGLYQQSGKGLTAPGIGPEWPVRTPPPFGGPPPPARKPSPFANIKFGGTSTLEEPPPASESAAPSPEAPTALEAGPPAGPVPFKPTYGPMQAGPKWQEPGQWMSRQVFESPEQAEAREIRIAGAKAEAEQRARNLAPTQPDWQEGPTMERYEPDGTVIDRFPTMYDRHKAMLVDGRTNQPIPQDARVAPTTSGGGRRLHWETAADGTVRSFDEDTGETKNWGKVGRPAAAAAEDDPELPNGVKVYLGTLPEKYKGDRRTARLELDQAITMLQIDHPRLDIRRVYETFDAMFGTAAQARAEEENAPLPTAPGGGAAGAPPPTTPLPARPQVPRKVGDQITLANGERVYIWEITPDGKYRVDANPPPTTTAPAPTPTPAAPQSAAPPAGPPPYVMPTPETNPEWNWGEQAARFRNWLAQPSARRPTETERIREAERRRRASTQQTR
jgi:hypothetical protein